MISHSVSLSIIPSTYSSFLFMSFMCTLIIIFFFWQALLFTFMSLRGAKTKRRNANIHSERFCFFLLCDLYAAAVISCSLTPSAHVGEEGTLVSWLFNKLKYTHTCRDGAQLSFSTRTLHQFCLQALIISKLITPSDMARFTFRSEGFQHKLAPHMIFWL